MFASKKTISVMSALILTSIMAACGGGGSTTPGPGGGGHPTPTPTQTPTSIPTPALMGTEQVAAGGSIAGGVTYMPAGAAQVVFSCGCSIQAGTGTTDAGGNFTLVAMSTPTPAAPNPTYTIVPGRNYLVIAKSGAGAEAWNLEFAGSIPSHDIALTGAAGSDVYSAAASLYIFQNSNGVTAFDDWNYNTIAAWLTKLHNTPNPKELQLLNDIVNESIANHTLYPSHPAWNAAQPTNAPIAADLAAVKTSFDPTRPTPCPTDGSGNGLCTGTPTP